MAGGAEAALQAGRAEIEALGDTINHLPDFGAVEKLIERASIELPPGGMLVVSFRDYSVPLTGEQRFIPVISRTG